MKILILLGGDPPERSLLCKAAEWADRVLCADSGAEALRDSGILPDLLMGDMDSIEPETLKEMEGRGVKPIRFDPHKDLTDGQLVCEAAIESGAEEVWILGGWGGRADHTFANLMLLRRFAEAGVKAVLSGPGQRMTVLGPGTYTVQGESGRTFSILPFSDGVRVTIDGAEYPLERPTPMPMGPDSTSPIGLSNRFTERETVIRILAGHILLFTPEE